MEDGVLSVIVACLGAITQLLALKRMQEKHEIALIDKEGETQVRVEQAKLLALHAADKNFQTDIQSLQDSITGLRTAWDQDLTPLKKSVDALGVRLKIIEDQPRRSK